MSQGWALPGMLAALSTTGLVVGLLADGMWDWAASGTLLLPLIVAWRGGRR